MTSVNPSCANCGYTEVCHTKEGLDKMGFTNNEYAKKTMGVCDTFKPHPHSPHPEIQNVREDTPEGELPDTSNSETSGTRKGCGEFFKESIWACGSGRSPKHPLCPKCKGSDNKPSVKDRKPEQRSKK